MKFSRQKVLPVSILLCTFTIIAVSLSTVQSTHNYLRPLSEQKQNAFLTNLNVANCQDLPIMLDTSLSFVQALIHEKGICHDQDLQKAITLYETAISQHQATLLSSLRLALIYRYGPYNLRDREKSFFLFKQIAIETVSLSSQMSPDSIEELLRAHLDGLALPPDLILQLNWINNVMEQSPKHRKAISIELQDRGFNGVSAIANRAQ
ncbi:MAG: hypothetical protein ACRBCK_04560 [Alphaproteobacteria bacterium]